MHTLAIKAVVWNPDGSLFYRQEHEWTNIDDKMLTWFGDKLAHLAKFAKDHHGKKEDDANLTAVLSGAIDGKAEAIPATTFTGVSYHALSKFEREFHNIGDELIKVGEEKVKTKAKHKK